MLYLSDILISNQDVETFEELCELIKEFARRGEMHLHFNVKPEYPDTPEDWEDRLEAAFNGVV